MRKVLLVLMALVLLGGYLALWPVQMNPVAWQPSPAPPVDRGDFAHNEKLRGLQRIADGALAGPEALAFDQQGNIYSGLEDGRVVSISADGKTCRVLANTGGRPLGLKLREDGRLWIADAAKGLLELDSQGKLSVLADRAEGIALGLTDDLDIDAQGRAYFSDASWKFPQGNGMSDAIEHGARGRLLRFDPAIGEAVTLLAQLQFANGVALGPDEEYVLVSETTEYRVTRFGLKGERAGKRETFIDNLPGFPDNITFNGDDRFWLALYGPRSALLDWLAPHPRLRRVLARLPGFMLPKVSAQAYVIGLDLEGKVAEQYQFNGSGAFGPVTSVIEHRGMLYLGSLSDHAIARVSLDTLRGAIASPAPPPPISANCVAASS